MRTAACSLSLCLAAAAVLTAADADTRPAAEADRDAAGKQRLEDKIMEAVRAYAEADDHVEAMLAEMKQAENELAQFLKNAQEKGIRVKRTDPEYEALLGRASPRRIWRYAGRRSPKVRAAIDQWIERYPPRLGRDFFYIDTLPMDNPNIKVLFPDPKATTPETFTHVIKDGDTTYTIDYSRFSLYTHDCKFLYPAGDHPWELDPAKFPAFDHGPDRTYVGKIHEYPTWFAIGYVREDGTVRGLIYGERRQEWTDFEGTRILRRHLDKCRFRDDYYTYVDIEVPAPGFRDGPIYEIPIGIEISYQNLLKSKGSIPILFEVLEMAWLEVATAYWGHCRMHVRPAQVVVRTGMKTCPHATRFKDFDETTTPVWAAKSLELPEEYFPELTAEERSYGPANNIGRQVWPKVWPELKVDKIIHINFGAVASLGGNVCSTHFYPSTRLKPYNKIPCREQILTHTLLHEFSHTYRGRHFTGYEEGLTMYAHGGHKPSPTRIVGSHVVKFRKHHEDTYREHNRPVRIATDTSDAPLPPYASLEMLQIVNTGQKKIDVLANDHDYNGDPIQLVFVDKTSRRGGTVTVSADHTVVYTPPAHKIGLDRFKYRIADSTGYESVGYVIIDLVNPSQYYYPGGPETAESRGFTGAQVAFVPRTNRRKATAVVADTLPVEIMVPEAGHYTIDFKFFIRGDWKAGVAPRTHLISVNGKAFEEVVFHSPQPTDEWRRKKVYNLPLKKGANTLMISSLSGNKVSGKAIRGNLPSTAPTTFRRIAVSSAGSYIIGFSGAGRNASFDLIESGELFKTHVNGLEYGWSSENAPSSAGAVGFMDRRGQATGNKWEMVLPNGTYNVLLGCRGGEYGALDYHAYKTDIFREGSGKASNVNNFRVEGVPFHDTDGPENILNLIEHQVTVKDGRLTVEVGEGALAPRLCYINISRVN